MDSMPPFRHHKPLEVAPDTYLIRQVVGEGTPAPVHVYINSLVINGKEPVIVDAGFPNNREHWINDVFSIVDPRDVRWIFLSHDDADHWGNLREAMEMCPNATLVTNWFSVERLAGVYDFPLERMRWVNDGDTFDAGDRTFAAIRPPIFDAPTTRGLYDPKTGVYWSSDAFGTPILSPVENVAELDPDFWEQGSGYFSQLVCPWLEVVDHDKFIRTVDRIARLEPKVIVGGHGPAITGENIARTLEFARRAPLLPPAELPGQAELEAMVVGMTHASEEQEAA